MNQQLVTLESGKREKEKKNRQEKPTEGSSDKFR